MTRFFAMRVIGNELFFKVGIVEHIRLIYCPAHKIIKKNEIADNLAETAAKKASHHPPRTDLPLSKVKEIKKQMTLDKWCRRWEIPIQTVYQHYTNITFCNLRKPQGKEHLKFCK